MTTTILMAESKASEMCRKESFLVFWVYRTFDRRGGVCDSTPLFTLLVSSRREVSEIPPRSVFLGLETVFMRRATALFISYLSAPSQL